MTGAAGHPAATLGTSFEAMTDPVDPRDDVLRRQAWDWLLRVSSGHATKADLAALNEWRAQSPLHAAAFAKARERWRLLGHAMADDERRSVPQPAAGERAVLGRRAVLGGAIAASAAAAVAITVRPPLDLWPSIGELAADHRTAIGEQRRVALGEGVALDLNTRTSLNVRATTTDAERIELIAGEAAITTRSRPVEVIAGRGRVFAEAAQFNVRHDGPEVCVTCLAGTIEVGRDGQSVAMQQSQQVVYGDRGLGPLTVIDPAAVRRWLEGDIFFENERLARVIDEVNRYRRGRIVLMNASLGERRFTARFKLDRLDGVIAQLRATFGARVTELPGGVVLVS